MLIQCSKFSDSQKGFFFLTFTVTIKSKSVDSVSNFRGTIKSKSKTYRFGKVKIGVKRGLKNIGYVIMASDLAGKL